MLLFGAGLGLDRDPGLMTIEILGFIGVPVTGVGVIKVRLTRPYALGWANAGVLLLWPFFGFWSFLLIADIIRHGVGHWDGGDLMEVAPPIFLIVTTCLVVRLNYINHWGFAAKPAS